MSFFRYPGGKKKIRKVIQSKLLDLKEQHAPEPLQYREPFFGAGSIGLLFLSESDSTKNIWINDKDKAICCLWTSIINYHQELIELIKVFTPSVENFYSIKKELLELDTMPTEKNKVLDIALKKIAIHQISFSGLGPMSGGPLGGKEQKSKYTIDCRWSPKYICKNITVLNERLSKIQIQQSGCTNLDFASVVEDESQKALIYLDPPYYFKGNELYQYGFLPEDHERLATCLKKTEHLWLLSYDDCPEIRDLYSWATIEELEVKYSIAGSTKKGELLISKS
jgi:DNA adenine methylase